MNESYLSIKLDKIVITKNNPRIVNKKNESFKDLTESIKGLGGNVNPVHVRSFPPGVQLIPKGKKDHYELLAGERRYWALKAAKLTEIKAISHGEITDAEAFEITFAENFGNEDLTPVEQGRAVGMLLEKYEGDYVAAASKLGKDVKWVRQRALIHTQLSDGWKEAIAQVEELAYLTTAHLGLIARFPAETQKVIAAHIKGHYCKYSVAALDKKIGDWMRLIAKAPFDNSGCQNCPKRSGAQPGLFSDKAEGDSGKNDKCLDLKCWDKKETAHNKAAFIERKQKYPDGLLCVATSWMGAQDGAGKLKKTYGKIIDHYGFTKAKKKDKGSVPALVVFGTGKGTVIYIKVKQPSSSNAAGNKKPPLKELREGLKQKRWRETIKRFIAQIEEIPAADRANNAAGRFATALLTAVFTSDTNLYGSKADEFLASAIELYKTDQVKAEVKVSGQMWENVQGNLEYQMNTRGDKDSIKQARLVASLFDIGLDEIYKVVCSETEFAEPAEWADLNANGTKKKAKVTKKKKSA